MLKKFLSNINPVEVIKLFKKSDQKYMTKGILQMGGSGLLIPSGVTMLTDGVLNKDWYEIVGGTIMLVIGSVLAIMLANKVEDLKNGKPTDNTEL